MGSSFRALEIVRRHVPKIHFPTRLERLEQMAVQQRQNPTEKLGLSGTPPLAPPPPPVQKVASSHSGFAKSFRELPTRYRRKPLDQTEIEYIQRGGPE